MVGAGKSVVGTVGKMTCDHKVLGSIPGSAEI